MACSSPKRYATNVGKGEGLTLLSMPDDIIAMIARKVATGMDDGEENGVRSLLRFSCVCRRTRSLAFPSSSRSDEGTLLWRHAANSSFQCCDFPIGRWWNHVEFICSREAGGPLSPENARACGRHEHLESLPHAALGILANGCLVGSSGVRADSLNLRRIASLRMQTDRQAVLLVATVCGAHTVDGELATDKERLFSSISERFTELIGESRGEPASGLSVSVDETALETINGVRELLILIARGHENCIIWPGLVESFRRMYYSEEYTIIDWFEFVGDSNVRGLGRSLSLELEFILLAICGAEELSELTQNSDDRTQFEYAVARLGTLFSDVGSSEYSKHLQPKGHEDCFHLMMHLERIGRELRRRIAAFAISKGRRLGLLQKIALLNKLLFLNPEGVLALADHRMLGDVICSTDVCMESDEEDDTYNESTCLGFTGDVDDYYNPDNSILHNVFSQRKGIPITLAVIYVAIGRRAGIELTMQNLPMHLLVMTDPSAADGKLFLIDVFRGGRVYTGVEEVYPAPRREKFTMDTRDVITRICRNVQANENAHGKSRFIANYIRNHVK